MRQGFIRQATARGVRPNMESSTTASTSSSGQQGAGSSGGRHHSQDSRKSSGPSRQYSSNTRSNSSTSSSYQLDYGNSTETRPPSFEVDSRRSSGELAGHSGQQSSSVLAWQMFFENMSPISEISSSSSMQERRG